MIFIMVMKEFDQKLTEISGLIHELDADSYCLERKAVRLALDLEELAEQYGLYIQADIALVRGELLCGYPAEKAGLLSRKERSKEKQRYIVNELSRLVQLVENYFADARKRFEECEQICGQMIINAYYRGLNKANSDLYMAISRDAELAPHLAEMHGAVGCANAKVIFEQAKAYAKYEVNP